MKSNLFNFSIIASLFAWSYAFYNQQSFKLSNSALKYSSNEMPISANENAIKSVSNIVKSTASAIAVGLIATKSFADETTVEPTYITTDSGLKYSDTKIGDGATPVPGDTVRVHYTGWLDGFDGEKKFDSSYDRRSPLVFKVGVRQVIAGWDEALLTNMKVGTKRNVIIPSELGYGSRGAGGVIPPGATLYFTMELVGIGNR